MTRVVKHKSKMFIDPRIIFDKQQQEKLISQSTKSSYQGTAKFHSTAAEKSNNFQMQTVIGQEYVIDILCSDCDASKRNATYHENVSIKLSLPRCLLNHGNGDGELNYSSFERYLIEKKE